jgi:heptaprenyl diphosphate synthase
VRGLTSRLPDPVHEARALVAADLARFESTLTVALEPQAPYLSETEYETYRRGKKLRPLILLLSSRLCAGPAGDLPQKAINASVSLEMLHVATLIHDDIVDVAPMRRGLRTVYSERGTEMAVLIGDLQFIQAVRCFAEGIDTKEDMALVTQVLDVGFQICCGELDEIMTDPTLDAKTLEKRYMQTVNRKTAALFALACESGALLAGGSKSEAFHLSQFGRRFGVAFQIMDDIFDFVRPEALSGKAPGKDLEQGRVTLPLIYALQELGDGHAAQRIMRREAFTPQELESTVHAVTQSDGMLRAYSKARKITLEAVDFLSWFPPSPYRDALLSMSHYIIDRGFLSAEA